MYKNQLQTYTQKKNITLPTYYCERNGPIHASRFKARVVVDGKTFEATEYCNSIKEAEHAAAKVALKSLALDGIKEDDLGLYKNLVQELAQKEGFNLPEYNTSTTGKSHMPVFVSTVKVNGEIYHGPQSKTKKQAEMGAAKVAYNCLKE
ncbi:Double-stranded RNA-binding domain, partial [Dillenia turbinata]